MSTNLLTTTNLDLLIPSLIQASSHALAFRRAASVRALGAPRAHVLHARALSRRVALPPSSRPVSGPCSPAEPRHALAHSPVPSMHSLAPYSAALAARRHRQRALPWTAPPKPPARASCPLGTARAYPHARRHALVAATTPCSYRTATRRRSYPPPWSQPRRAYIRRPRTPPST